MSRSEFVWVEKYRPKTIDECILPDNIKKTFNDFLDKGEVPNLLLSGPPGCGKTTVAKALCHQLGADYYVMSETMRRISLRPSRFRQILNTKSSSLTKLTTQPQMYNSVLGRLLRSSLAIADSSSPATTKTKSSNHFIPVAQWLNLELEEKKDNNLQEDSSKDSKKSWIRKVLDMTKEYWQN